jgi:hypothetical protein
MSSAYGYCVRDNAVAPFVSWDRTYHSSIESLGHYLGSQINSRLAPPVRCILRRPVRDGDWISFASCQYSREDQDTTSIATNRSTEIEWLNYIVFTSDNAQHASVPPWLISQSRQVLGRPISPAAEGAMYCTITVHSMRKCGLIPSK